MSNIGHLTGCYLDRRYSHLVNENCWEPGVDYGGSVTGQHVTFINCFVMGNIEDSNNGTSSTFIWL